jgi:hypothetical protein
LIIAAAWQLGQTLPLIGCASFSIIFVSASRSPGTARIPVD